MPVRRFNVENQPVSGPSVSDTIAEAEFKRMRRELWMQRRQLLSLWRLAITTAITAAVGFAIGMVLNTVSRNSAHEATFSPEPAFTVYPTSQKGVYRGVTSDSLPMMIGYASARELNCDYDFNYNTTPPVITLEPLRGTRTCAVFGETFAVEGTVILIRNFGDGQVAFPYIPQTQHCPRLMDSMSTIKFVYVDGRWICA